MAVQSFGVNDALTVKLWAKKLSVEALKATQLQKCIGTPRSALVQMRDELSKGPGDTVTYGLRMQATGPGVQGDGTLEGNEEALATYSDKLIVDQLRHAHRWSGKMSQQRVPFEAREEMLSSLTDWWAGRLDFAFFQQIAGYTLTTDTRYTGNQAVPATDALHYLNAANIPTTNGLAAPTNTDTDVATMTYSSAGGATLSSAFSLSMIDRAKERAKTMTPAIRPVRIGGKDWFVAFLHPNQVTDLRTNPNPGGWFDIQKAAMTGGELADNPLFTGALGTYNGVVLHEDARVPAGISQGGVALPQVRRAIFCGAQAAGIAFGKNDSFGKFDWVEELFDYENQLGTSAGAIFGLKKTQFNGQDFSTIVMSSFAASH